MGRAMEIKVDLVRHKNDPLGLHFRDPVGYSLIVTKVDPGSLMDQWNKDKGGGEKKVKLGHATQEDKDLQIRKGDRIIAVSGLAAKAGDLHRRINSPQERFSFTVVRPW